jgi:hypothetical protein
MNGSAGTKERKKGKRKSLQSIIARQKIEKKSKNLMLCFCSTRQKAKRIYFVDIFAVL